MSMRKDIEKVLETVRPYIQADGGDVKLVDVNDKGEVRLKLTGACSGCPSSALTLKMGIERTLKEKIPSITSVISV